MNLTKRQIDSAVVEEIYRAASKFPNWPTDPIHAKSILNEEVGELEQAILEVIYEPEKSTMDDVMKEAIQVIAMGYRFLLSIDEYSFTPCEQHVQKV